ncbi:mechanosensitive ion channel [Oxynema aestuarii AP17]|jgi:hypothetical protein|uniref:Mechanosensitive ion channel n=1 Tax=Oxynema aestuarii AP17 TaxID=2064643 RepID=A0A6H1U404_9CYAN|nr:mechanosensitive ion channel [Oxynema aestuarii AP17]RMH77171.1 MAG: hypothetical protein D6680_05895 [Cyanobacteria bacterium J007]
MNDMWYIRPEPVGDLPNSVSLLAQTSTGGFDPQAMVVNPVTNFVNGLMDFLPSLLGAIAILIVGWLAATIIAAGVRGLLNRTDIDNRIANAVMGRQESPPPIEKWAASGVYWVIMIFVLVAFFNALKLEVVSQPLNSFLDQIFNYLPRLGGAALLLGVAWIVATICKMLLTTGLQRFRLDDRLAQQTGEGESPFMLNETLANALYWFVFLFFLPPILDALQLPGALTPVQNLVDQILSALPKILTAVIIGAIGWLIARIVRGIVTNLLAATGTDRLGQRMGLTQQNEGMSLSGLIGTTVYVLILIPTAIAALNSLQIEAISDPAIAMLQQILDAIPKIFTAGLIFGVFYVVGRFVSDFVTNILTSIGFNNIFAALGFSRPSTASTPADSTPESGSDLTSKTPSEIVGIVVMVAILLFAAVAATEVLQFEVLTIISGEILRIAGLVLVGVIVFGIGLYLANLAYSLIAQSKTAQAEILGQAARISIIALAGAMALQQMGIAPHIVNLAFGLLFGAIAVAIALAFGLGGRDVAGEQLRDWLAQFKNKE